jgi:hypothetical protein
MTVRNGYSAIRALSSHSTGLYYYEVTPNVISGTGAWIIGIGNATASVSNFVGNDANSIGVTAAGTIWFNSANPVPPSPVAPYTVGNTVGVAVDLTNKKIWFRTNAGNWNNDVIANQNPVGNVGGAGFSTSTGPWFPMWNGGAVNDQVTASFGATTYAQPVPSGFGNW